LKGW